jgi:methionyl-tRNA formyltransferase
MRLIFMGTPAFAVPTLETMPDMGHDIAAVFCQPDRPAGRGRSIAFSPVKQKAIEFGLPIYQPENLNTLQVVQTISNFKPEILVVVAYGLKLPKEILDIPKQGAINLHPSMLPKYRGAAPINHALINGDQMTGITSILMNEKMDAGDIVLQEEVRVHDNENAGELETRLALLGADLMARSMDVISGGNYPFKKQDEALVTFAPKLSPENGHINWNKTSLQIKNQILGVTPRPGAFSLFKEKRLEILKIDIEYQSSNIGGKPGTMISIDKNSGPIVKTGDGVAVLTGVKPQGKKEMSGSEFVRGYRPEAGDILL